MRLHRNSTRPGLVVRLFALMIALVFAMAGCSGSDSSDTPTGEIWLATATDAGHNPFMASVAPPPPVEAKPGPKLTPKGNGKDLVPQTQPGNQEGLYGGTMNNSECDREKMIGFLQSHPPQAPAFVTALNTDRSLFWSKGSMLRVDQIPDYIHEMTPSVLRVDTRVTNFGFDGTNPTPLQHVLQAGTAVLVDAHGVPRARCYCGNPLTAPSNLQGTPTEKGVRWTGYNPGAVVIARPSTTVISSFALVDIVTTVPFNRPAGTDGIRDTARKEAGGPVDGAYSGGGFTVSVENGRITRMTERVGGSGCELAIAADFTVDTATGAFSGPWTSTVISGDCTGANGTMEGKITGGTMSFTLVNQSAGRTFTNALQRN